MFVPYGPLAMYRQGERPLCCSAARLLAPLMRLPGRTAKNAAQAGHATRYAVPEGSPSVLGPADLALFAGGDGTKDEGRSWTGFGIYQATTVYYCILLY